MTSRLVQVLTIRELDARLTAMCEAFKQADADCDMESADAAYAEIDTLLDARIKAVQQRRPTP